jgi:hypothetical protein
VHVCELEIHGRWKVEGYWQNIYWRKARVSMGSEEGKG